MRKTIIVNQNAQITKGAMSRHIGLVVGYDYATDEVDIRLDRITRVIVPSDAIEQWTTDNEGGEKHD